MKKTLLAVAATALIGGTPAALMLFSPPARAQWVVIDPTNLVQNVLTAARSLEQINNQILSLQHEAQMLVNEAKQLQGLDYNSLSTLLNTTARTNALISQAQGLTFEVAQAQATYARLYGPSYTSSTSSTQMLADAQERWDKSRAALQTATQLQSQAAQNLLTDQDSLAALVTQSQSAVGQLQATQATNQLLALLVRQLIQAQQLQLSQDRAGALESARRAGAEARGQAVRERFLGSGTAYTPQAVHFYGD